MEAYLSEIMTSDIFMVNKSIFEVSVKLRKCLNFIFRTRLIIFLKILLGQTGFTGVGLGALLSSLIGLHI